MRARRWAGWHAGRASVAGLAAFLAACSSSPSGPPVAVDLDQDGLEDAVEADLAAQYRPYWFFDGDETIYPLSVTALAELGGSVEAGGAMAAYDDRASLLAAVLLHPAGTIHLPPGPLSGGAGAPVYVDAVPMPAGYAIGAATDLVWLHYWLLFPDDVKTYLPSRSHRGDWEHVCVMVERSALGDRARPPVMIHWHHHGAADISPQADAWHEDARGAFHPRAYVEAGGHAVYRLPGVGPGAHDDGQGTLGDPLADPLVFLVLHGGQDGAAAEEARIVRAFGGAWGQTTNPAAPSPHGPFSFNSVCDHDYTLTPTAASFALEGCPGL